MANWLSSDDAVVLFTRQAALSCNAAATLLFSLDVPAKLSGNRPAALLLDVQPDGSGAAERLEALLTEAEQEGAAKATVVGRRADGKSFYARLVIVTEKDRQSGEALFCTKWLPFSSFSQAQHPEFFNFHQQESGKVAPVLAARATAKELEVQEGLAKYASALSQENSGYDLPAHVYAPVHLQQEIEALRLENKRLQQEQLALRKNKEYLRLLAASSPDMIMQFDREHRHLYVNDQVMNHFPFPVEDFLGKTHQQMGFPAGYSKNCSDAMEQVFNTGQPHRLDLELPAGQWIDWLLVPEWDEQHERVLSVITTAREITRYKKTTADLQKSQQWLKDAFEVTKLSSWEYLMAEDSLLFNEESRNLLAIEQPLENCTGSQFLKEFILPEDQNKLRHILKLAKEAGQPDFKEVVDYRLRQPDGSIIHVLSSVRLEISPSGELQKVYGTAQDITQLRLTEQELEEYRTGLEQLVETRTQELRKSEEKLADALRLASLGTWEFDPVTACFIVSDHVLEIFGTTSEIEEGNMIPVQRMLDCIYQDDRAKYLETVERIYESAENFHTDRVELRIRRSDGDIRHLYVSIKLGKSGNFTKYYGTLQDITLMRQTEHEKDRLTAIVETTSDIIGIVGIEGNILYLNKAGKEFFGIKDEASLLQKTFSNFQSHKLTTVLSRRELRHADKWGTWSGQNRYLRHDGSAVHVSQVIVSHKNAEGQVQCYSTILRDMSAQKKIEQDLIFKNNELDTFIYRASHDLRGPIATMMGLNQIVRFEIKDPVALDYFDLYNSQIMRLHNITVSLIELTKIKDRSCEITSVDFGAIWQEVCAEVAALPESSAVSLQCALRPVQHFNSDAHLIKIILYNLIENSIRYRRSDMASFVKMEVTQSSETRCVTLKVSDNGIGISGELQNKIYNMFFRGTERSKGPGLGLYMLKNAVEKLSGRINLYSVPYKGTTFKIELPSLAPGSCLPS